VELNEPRAMEVLGVASAEEARQKIMGNLHRNGMAMIDSINEYLKSQEGQQLLEQKLASYAS